MRIGLNKVCFKTYLYKIVGVVIFLILSNNTINAALLVTCEDPVQREIIKNSPFGNLTVLFVGDLWQLGNINLKYG